LLSIPRLGLAVLAVSAGCDIIVTYKKADFKGVEKFGVRVSTPSEKLSALITEEYLEKRARRGNRTQFERAMAKVPRTEPEESDRMPA